jgi:hypothetical protein
MIGVRVTIEEHQEIKRKAKEAGLSISDYVGKLLKAR